MKKILFSLLALFLGLAASAQTKWYEGYEMGLGGKILQTTNPYHRIDTVGYAFVGHEKNLVICSGGLTLHFKTNSRNIRLDPEYGYIYPGRTTNQLAVMGFDIYIREGKKWLWAGAAVQKPGREDRPVTIVSDMDGTEHECLIYLPMYSELRSLKVGLDEGSTMIPCGPSSKYSVVFYG